MAFTPYLIISKPRSGTIHPKTVEVIARIEIVENGTGWVGPPIPITVRFTETVTGQSFTRTETAGQHAPGQIMVKVDLGLGTWEIQATCLGFTFIAPDGSVHSMPPQTSNKVNLNVVEVPPKRLGLAIIVGIATGGATTLLTANPAIGVGTGSVAAYIAYKR